MPRVLIIEDDTDINNSTAQYLRRQGCGCVQAYSGTEGRRLWQEGGFDLLLVDLMLPGLSGGGRIRRPANTRMIFITGASTGRKLMRNISVISSRRSTRVSLTGKWRM